MKKGEVKRRTFFKYAGLLSTCMLLGGSCKPRKLLGKGTSAKIYKSINEAAYQTPMVDAHEHFYTEKLRLSAKSMVSRQCNDWTILLNHYLNSDMQVSGMSNEDYKLFFSPDVDPSDKWKYLAPVWEYVKYTGYAQAVRLTIKELYGIDDITKTSVPQLQKGYMSLLKPGYYKKILQQTRANIESCQVDPLSGYPVMKSEYPDFIMSDLKVNELINQPGKKELAEESGINPATLSDWHSVIDYWFNTYGKYVVATKISLAYGRRIDFIPTEADVVAGTYAKVIQDQDISREEKKALEDHLFWYVVNKATDFNLPVKIHVGYLAGQNSMKLERVKQNPSDAAALCRNGKSTRFVFFHISYPYYEEMLAVAKHYENAYIDMCWSWIINPISAKEFLKKFIVTVPNNKLIVFGGDYRAVESTVGHAILARNGIVQALGELIDESYLTESEAIHLAEPLLRGNCFQIFDLKAKKNLLENMNWDRI